ncbi:G1 family glutamic endopeptidase [Streptomyces coeruleorubidus]|uniref:G1 family glutamic endopeptidase n=1 Tax=Streptomyces coeruleorubidus TaxID=116188 RepID=A0ABZ0KRF3_STRC4|nr:G1 family glutamic endopeptidase [Streptomyces coeruleorubidus]WOT40647.1 G1 family glutamic endopeptidase [Streptomyces coeruleorubidus]
MRPPRCLVLAVISAIVSALLSTLGPQAVARPYGLVRDPGFEQQNSRTVSGAWQGEGPDYKGIDIGLGYHKTGRNNAFIRTSSRKWNAIKQQVTVKRQTVYYLEGWVRTSGNFTTGYFGARGTDGRTIVQKNFGKVVTNGAYQYLQMAFNSGNNTQVTLYVGYNAPGSDSWVQIDDIDLADTPYTNWAGYVVPSSPANAAPRTVTAVWTQPAFTCQDDPDNHVGVWVGLDGLDTSETESLVQVGTHAACRRDDIYPQHRAFWEVIDAGRDSTEQTIPMEVEAGDRISASVVRSSADPTVYILTIDNLTRPGQRRTLTKKASAARSESAEIIVERPTVTPFGATWPRPLNVPFSYVTVDGAPLSSYDTLTMRGRQDDKRIVYAPSPAVTDSGGYSNFTLSSRTG